MKTSFLTNQELAMIERAIVEAERKTSAEIVVCIKSESCVADKSASVEAIRAAVELVAQEKLRQICVGKTRDKNGVIIMISPEDRHLAICGDKAVSDVIKNWPDVTTKVIDDIKSGNPARGIIGAIKVIGRRLKRRFPIKPDDQNEISNRVIIE
jgi:uncharacterized membrane protein